MEAGNPHGSKGIDNHKMANKKGTSVISKEVEIKKVISNGHTSKQAFKKVEEEQCARLARQRKAEEEWLQKLIQKEEDRKKRIQKIVTKEESKKKVQHTSFNKKSDNDIQQKLIKNLEVEQQQIGAQIKGVKAVHKIQMLDRINEEIECTTSRTKNMIAPQISRISTRRIYVASSFG